MTPNGIVVELQHSSISTEDITEREYFYTRKASGLIWLMDGTNLPHDRFVDEGDGWFKWKHPRKTWLTITAPQFWDMGSEIWEVIATCETGVKIRKMDVDDFVSLALGATEDGEYGSRGYFTRVTQLRDENHRLAAENHRLKAKASMAGDEKLGLIAKNHRLKDEVSRLKAAVLRGRSEVSRLTGDLTQLRDENHRLQAVVTRSGGREGFEERLEREKRYHQQDMKEFEARLDAAHQRSKRHHEEAEDWQRRHHQARAEARVLKAEVSRLQKCLRKAEVRLKREKSRLDDARPRTEIIEFALRDNDLVVGDDLLEDLDHIR